MTQDFSTSTLRPGQEEDKEKINNALLRLFISYTQSNNAEIFATMLDLDAATTQSDIEYYNAAIKLLINHAKPEQEYIESSRLKRGINSVVDLFYIAHQFAFYEYVEKGNAPNKEEGYLFKATLADNVTPGISHGSLPGFTARFLQYICGQFSFHADEIQKKISDSKRMRAEDGSRKSAKLSN